MHAGALLLLLLSVASSSRSSPPMYAVELVAAPASSAPSRPAPERRSTPVAPPVPVSKPKPAPAKPTTAEKSVPKPRSTTPVTPLPGEIPGTGSDIANVNLKGKPFPYPEYLRNLVAQIYRRWNRPPGNSALATEVAFVILRDGTVKDIEVVSSSRSYSFDLEARGAIEQAAAVKAFGALPAGYGADYLQINFQFTPRPVP